MTIDSNNMDFEVLNEKIRNIDGDITINNCLGQRFIASGKKDSNITIYGTPGNALGAYLNGANITVYGNAQDATGDTMNNGDIVIHGNIGDAAGYAMRGGAIYVRGNAGYRAGIHMKAYAEKLPVMVIGGSCGNFLGEYQAGGVIIVLGNNDKAPIVGDFCGTGMHGGKIFLRADELNTKFPKQVNLSVATKSDIDEIAVYINKYCSFFNDDPNKYLDKKFFVLTPNSANPYKQLYVQN